MNITLLLTIVLMDFMNHEISANANANEHGPKSRISYYCAVICDACKDRQMNWAKCRRLCGDFCRCRDPEKCPNPLNPNYTGYPENVIE